MATNKHGLSSEQQASLKAFVALVKKVGFPRGAGSSDSTKGTYGAPRCNVYWSKRGGLAGGKVISKVLSAARAAGFASSSERRHDVPDGSRIGSSNEMVLLDAEKRVVARIDYSRSYGAVAADNSYYLSMVGPDISTRNPR